MFHNEFNVFVNPLEIKKSKPSILYIVATPIGNLDDITIRAEKILSEVDLIAAEDTRHSRVMLNHLGINKKMIALHEHNELKASMKIIDYLKQGKNIAYISDAGTPTISDPGFHLLNCAYQNNIKVVPVPGASSVITALSVCGFDLSSFIFFGFLSAKKNKRQEQLKSLALETRTLVIFEAPHRIKKSINEMIQQFGPQRNVCFCRELTKKFENINRSSLQQLAEMLDNDTNQSRGEIVLIIEGAKDSSLVKQDIDVQQLMSVLYDNLSAKQASAVMSKLTNQSKRYYYQLALENKNKS